MTLVSRRRDHCTLRTQLLGHSPGKSGTPPFHQHRYQLYKYSIALSPPVKKLSIPVEWTALLANAALPKGIDKVYAIYVYHDYKSFTDSLKSSLTLGQLKSR